MRDMNLLVPIRQKCPDIKSVTHSLPKTRWPSSGHKSSQSPHVEVATLMTLSKVTCNESIEIRERITTLVAFFLLRVDSQRVPAFAG